MNSKISVTYILQLINTSVEIFCRITSYHLGVVHKGLQLWFYQKFQPNCKNEVSDEEPSTHSPHQPQQVEGVKTGPFRHTGHISLDYFHFVIYKVLCSVDLPSCVREIQSIWKVNTKCIMFKVVTWKATNQFQYFPASSPSTSWPSDLQYWSTVPLTAVRSGSRPRRWG